jgi:Transglutaminase-like superfamily
VQIKLVASLLGIFLFASLSSAQQAQRQTNPDVTQLAQSVAGKTGNSEMKTRRLVNWINTNFSWSYTDYQKRKVEEIIQRRAGNCAELANVLAVLLKENNISFRWIHEINVQLKSERRQGDAVKLVSEKGKTYSVFGLMHNDHVWLEVYNEKSRSWIPADPAVGVVGMKEWVAARMAFAKRRKPEVPAVAEVVKEMIVPFAVIVFERRTGKPLEDRSEYYLVDGFNSFYGHKLKKLPSWKTWTVLDAELSRLSSAAFAGEINLHEHGELIEQIAQAYEKLKAEAAEHRILPKDSITN